MSIHLAGQKYLSNGAFGPMTSLYLKDGGQGPRRWREPGLIDELRREVHGMLQGRAALSGGLIYFPHDRELRPARGGGIEPPPEDRRWISRYSPENRWSGSLEQLWVWQNYLDLERRSRGEPASELASSIELLQAALSPGRKVLVREGRPRTTPPRPMASWASS